MPKYNEGKMPKKITKKSTSISRKKSDLYARIRRILEQQDLIWPGLLMPKW